MPFPTGAVDVPGDILYSPVLARPIISLEAVYGKMGASDRPAVSFVLATHNRCAVVSHALEQVARCGLDRGDFEVIVVDNASRDGSAEAVAEQIARNLPAGSVLLRLSRNAGSCAKAFGVERAAGEYIVFLDDDSFPRDGSIERMIERFEEDPHLGAAGFTVHLADGVQEGGALPGVFVGCGVGFRAEALRAVGGLDPTFFMQAEEYDLSFRLAAAGWTVDVFDDLHVEHLKAAEARSSERTTYLDVRNNLRVVARYLPSPYHTLYRDEWLLRYAWLAQRSGHIGPFIRGACAGWLRGVAERRAYQNHRLAPATFERFFQWDYVRSRMAKLADAGAGRVVFADLGKNIHAFHRAAREVGICVRAIGDDCLSAPDRRYRGIPVVGLDEALNECVDAVVVSNTSAVHAAKTLRRVVGRTPLPVHNWCELRVTSYELRRRPAAHSLLS